MGPARGDSERSGSAAMSPGLDAGGGSAIVGPDGVTDDGGVAVSLDGISDGGRFAVLAIDHRDSLRAVLTPDGPDSVGADAITDLKRELVGTLAEGATGVMLEPEYSIPQLLDGTLPVGVGFTAALEAQGYAADPEGFGHEDPGRLVGGGRSRLRGLRGEAADLLPTRPGPRRGPGTGGGRDPRRVPPRGDPAGAGAAVLRARRPRRPPGAGDRDRGALGGNGPASAQAAVPGGPGPRA